VSVPDELDGFVDDIADELSDRVSESIVAEVRDDVLEDLSPQLAQQLSPGLEPMPPEEGISRYLDVKSDEVRPGTLDQYRTKMSYVREYLLQERALDNLNNMTPLMASDYKQWREEESLDREKPLEPKTVKDDMHLYKEFLEYLATWRAVSSDVPESVQIPELDDGVGVEKETLAPERAASTNEYLARFEYGSIEQAVWLVFTKTGRRPCDLHALDLGDFNYSSDGSTLEFVHRPESGTPLKEGLAHEASISLTEEVGEALQDYVVHQRQDVTDDTGREPLFTTANGRISKSTIQEYVYKWSRPCAIGEECPHDRDPAECEAAQTAKAASKCPDSRSPRPIRSGYITAKLNAGSSYEAVCQRVGATKTVLKKHYDHPQKDDESSRYRDEIRESSAEGSGYANGDPES
jgi:hypothetical protein